MVQKLDLEPKCQGHSINQKTMTLETKNMPPPKNLSRASSSYWYDADVEQTLKLTSVKQQYPTGEEQDKYCVHTVR